MTAIQNHTSQRYIPRKRLSDKWGYFDAQPLAIREALCAHPLNVWPYNYSPLSPADLDQLDTQYLAGLESVWGPDHPAVQDAKKRVTRTRKGFQRTGTIDDILDSF